MTGFGEFIREIRLRRGLTQTQLALQVGCRHSYIAKIETGRQRGSYHLLLKLAEILSLPSDMVLLKAGLQLVNEAVKPELDCNDLEFSRLSPRLKTLLLELAGILSKYMVKS